MKNQKEKTNEAKQKIEADLLNQLKQKNVTYAHYIDLVKDYLSLWEIKNQLKEDIDMRGVAVHWCNGGGQEGCKKNDSISELVKVNNQMLKILADLGIRGADIKVVEEDEEL